jgi:uncharacterized membrane protein YdbT with pleckstrin-like domain
VRDPDRRSRGQVEETADETAARAQVKQAEQQLDAAQREAVEKASQNARAAAEAAAKQLSEAKAAAAQAATVPTDQIKKLVDRITDFHSMTSSGSQRYDLAVTFVALGGIILSLVGALFSYFSWTKAAGFISIFVTAILTVPKVLPIEHRAKYFRILSTQSENLLLDATLSSAQAPSDYESRLKQLQILNNYYSEKYPNTTDIAETTTSLLKDLKASFPAK